MLRFPLAAAVVAVVLGLTLAGAAAGPTALADAGSAVEQRDGKKEGTRLAKAPPNAPAVETGARRFGIEVGSISAIRPGVLDRASA